MEKDEKGSDQMHKYYTAFVMFAQESLTKKTVQLHCTHKYLGVQPRSVMIEAFRVCEKYFTKPRVFPKAVFNERADFLKKRIDESGITIFDKVSVLKSFVATDNFFLDLRGELDHFRKDDHEQYTPHITVKDYPYVTGTFQCYAILSGEKILAWWGNQEWQRIQNAAESKKARLSERRKTSPFRSMDLGQKT